MRKTDRFDEGPVILDIFDAKTVPGFGENEIRFRRENEDMLFRRMAPSPFDLYLMDPANDDCQLFFRPEQILYQKGYKLVNKHVFLSSRISRTFNDRGLLVRQEKETYEENTGASPETTTITEWYYFPEQRMVLSQTCWPDESQMLNIQRYVLDPAFKIIKRSSYYVTTKSIDHKLPLNAESLNGMDEIRNLNYIYHDDGRISEIDIDEHGISEGKSRKLKFVYDEQSRMLRKKLYDWDNMLDEETVFEYLNESQVNFDFRFRICIFDEPDSQP